MPFFRRELRREAVTAIEIAPVVAWRLTFVMGALAGGVVAIASRLGAPVKRVFQLRSRRLNLLRSRLYRSEERYRAIVEAANDVIVSLAPDGVVCSLSLSFERTTGWSRSEWEGKLFFTIVHPDDREQAMDRFNRLLRGESVASMEIRLQSKEGSYVPLEFTVSSQVEGGRVVRVLGFGRDVTERKEVERCLQFLNEHLEEEVAARTRDLAHTADLLARSNKDLEEFAYIASHDLQEPLRMISSYLTLLKQRYRGKIDSTADEFIDFAVDGASRMKRLIDDLLNYSRVSASAVPFKEVDCQEVVASVLTNLKLAIEESGAKIEVSDLPKVIGEEAQIEHLFQNLIGNALKYHSNLAPEISIRATLKERRWVFEIQDNGIGFDARHSERIFQLFHRLHSKTEYPGTGLGLALCKKIVERHGGRIWAKAEVGRGALFTFELMPPSLEANRSPLFLTESFVAKLCADAV